jgi:hypothetical protein
MSSDAPPLLLEAARRLEPLDRELARETYLSAWDAAAFAERSGGGDLLEVCRAAGAPLTQPARRLASGRPLASDHRGAGCRGGDFAVGKTRLPRASPHDQTRRGIRTGIRVTAAQLDRARFRCPRYADTRDPNHEVMWQLGVAEFAPG